MSQQTHPEKQFGFPTPFVRTLKSLEGGIRLVGAFILIVIGALVIGLLPKRANTQLRKKIQQWWSAALLSTLGVEIKGHEEPRKRETGKGRLVVCNHVSFIDILVLNSQLPATFVSKADVASWPLVGWLARSSGTLFIDRGSRRAAHRTQDKIVDRLTTGDDIVIFPEGTTSLGHSVLPFHAALFQAAVDANSDVLCVTLRYRQEDGFPAEQPAYVGNISLVECLWRTVTAHGLRAELYWHPTLPHPHTDRRHLAKHAHRLVAHGLLHVDHPAGQPRLNTTLPDSLK